LPDTHTYHSANNNGDDRGANKSVQGELDDSVHEPTLRRIIIDLLKDAVRHPEIAVPAVQTPTAKDVARGKKVEVERGMDDIDIAEKEELMNIVILAAFNVSQSSLKISRAPSLD